MRVCVVGCGAIGSLFAARLAQHAEVWAYDVSRPMSRRSTATGCGPTARTTRIEARTDARAIPPCELGLVATKATFTDAALTATAHLFAGGAVCSVQNGIGSEEVARAPRPARDPRRDAAGRARRRAGRRARGRARHDLARAVRAAAGDAGRDRHARGRPRRVALPDARGAQWTKLLFNAATNPLAALTGLTHGQLCERPDLRRTITALVDEGRAVADALGITLDSDPDAMISRAAEENYAHRPSMLQDALAHRPTEIDALNGGIVAAGRAAGVATPLHAAIAALIAGMEAGYRHADHPSQ